MKKLKLFLSLCMMCFCIAVLCMGILAAGSATYQINGNISYNMIDGVARVNARVYKVAGTGTLTSDQLTSGYINDLSTMELENISKSTSPNYILTETKDTIAISENGGIASFTADIVYGANTDQSTYYTYFIVLNITNQSNDSSYALNAYINELGTSAVSNITTNATGNTNKKTISSGEFINIVIGLSYCGETISDTDKAFSCELTVEYICLEWFDFNLKGSYPTYTGSSETWNIDITMKFKYGVTWKEIVNNNSGILSQVNYYIVIKGYEAKPKEGLFNRMAAIRQNSSYVLPETITIDTNFDVLGVSSGAVNGIVIE